MHESYPACESDPQAGFVELLCSIALAPLNRLCPCYGAIEIVEVIIIIISIIGTEEKEVRESGGGKARGGEDLEKGKIGKGASQVLGAVCTLVTRVFLE